MDKSHTDAAEKMRLEEELDEVLLRHLMQEYMNRCGEDLLKEADALPDADCPEPTAKQLRQFDRRLKKAARQSGYKVRRIPRKAFPLIAVLVALLVITLATAGAFRLKLFNFLNVPGSIATEYGAQDVGDREYAFAYMPEGFSERFYNVSAEGIRAYYVHIHDKEKYVQILARENSQRISPDTENVELSESVQINESVGQLSLKDGLYTLAWIDSTSDTTYLIQSTLDDSETIKIAEGITKK